jgi:hypothetical protein
MLPPLATLSWAAAGSFGSCIIGLPCESTRASMRIFAGSGCPIIESAASLKWRVAVSCAAASEVRIGNGVGMMAVR